MEHFPQVPLFFFMFFPVKVAVVGPSSLQPPFATVLIGIAGVQVLIARQERGTNEALRLTLGPRIARIYG